VRGKLFRKNLTITVQHRIKDGKAQLLEFIKGFSGEWEEKKLGEIGEIVTGSTPSTQEPLYYSINGIPWVTPTDISKNITFYTARYLSSKGQEVARIVPKNTILVTCIASIGKNTLLGSIGSFNQQINGLIPNKNENNSYFLFIESIFWSNKMKKIAASGTMQIVNKKEFSKLRTFLPKLQEQTKIGNYFQKLDKLIELQKKELEKLKQLKKSLLSKMFI
jgi:type I restriction enzyme S subunit